MLSISNDVGHIHDPRNAGNNGDGCPLLAFCPVHGISWVIGSIPINEVWVDLRFNNNILLLDVLFTCLELLLQPLALFRRDARGRFRRNKFLLETEDVPLLLQLPFLIQNLLLLFLVLVLLNIEEQFILLKIVNKLNRVIETL